MYQKTCTIGKCATGSIPIIIKIIINTVQFFLWYMKAHGTNNKGLPHWLHWDEPANTLLGVPSKKDIGQHRVSIKAFGKHGDVAKDIFIIQVMQDNRDKSKHKDQKVRFFPFLLIVR